MEFLKKQRKNGNFYLVFIAPRKPMDNTRNFQELMRGSQTNPLKKHYQVSSLLMEKVLSVSTILDTANSLNSF